MNYKQSDQLSYKLCCKDRVPQDTYGRREIEPHPYLTAVLMGIYYAQLDKKEPALTPYKAHDRYLNFFGERTVVPKQTAESLSPANAGNLANFI
jgi:hypothetical protein